MTAGELIDQLVRVHPSVEIRIGPRKEHPSLPVWDVSTVLLVGDDKHPAVLLFAGPYPEDQVE